MPRNSALSRFRRRLTLFLGCCRIFYLILVAVMIVVFVFPFSSEKRRTRLLVWWARLMLRLCGLEVRLSGAVAPPKDGVMMVMNHISWIDIYVMDAFRPTRFVAKSEIRAWPVIGYLSARTGTIFIERSRRRAVREANHAVAEVLRHGGIVGVFPEGTTTLGSGLLPFHANLIQAAIEAGCPIQPVALRYLLADGTPTTAAAYIDDMTLFESLDAMLEAGPLIAELKVLEPIASVGRTRHELAREARAAIALSLAIDIGDRQSGEPAAFQDLLL